MEISQSNIITRGSALKHHVDKYSGLAFCKYKATRGQSYLIINSSEDETCTLTEISFIYRD